MAKQIDTGRSRVIITDGEPEVPSPIFEDPAEEMAGATPTPSEEPKKKQPFGLWLFGGKPINPEDNGDGA